MHYIDITLVTFAVTLVLSLVVANTMRDSWLNRAGLVALILSGAAVVASISYFNYFDAAQAERRTAYAEAYAECISRIDVSRTPTLALAISAEACANAKVAGR